MLEITEEHVFLGSRKGIHFLEITSLFFSTQDLSCNNRYELIEMHHIIGTDFLLHRKVQNVGISKKKIKCPMSSTQAAYARFKLFIFLNYLPLSKTYSGFQTILVQEELLHYPRCRRRPYPRRRRQQNAKVFTLKVLCNGQGADRRAILSNARSCYT